MGIAPSSVPRYTSSQRGGEDRNTQSQPLLNIQPTDNKFNIVDGTCKQFESWTRHLVPLIERMVTQSPQPEVDRLP